MVGQNIRIFRVQYATGDLGEGSNARSVPRFFFLFLLLKHSPSFLLNSVFVLNISFRPHNFTTTIAVILSKSISRINVLDFEKWVFLFWVLGTNLCIKKGDLPFSRVFWFLYACMYVKTDKLPNMSQLHLHFCR